jgi:hypothetical protein
MTRSKMALLVALTATGAGLVACGGDDNGSVDLGTPDASDATSPVDSGAGADASDAGSDVADGALPLDAANADGGKTLDGGSCGGPTFTVTSIDPQFGWTGGKTALSINGVGFIATPAVYLRSSTGAITELVHTAFVSSSSIVAEVDASLNLAAGSYDVGVVNPDTCAEFLAGVFKLVATPAPSDVSVAPAAGTTQVNTPVTISACDLPAAASLTLSTVDASGAPTAQTLTGASLACVADASCSGGQKCTVQGTIASSTMTAGLYVVRVSNTANGTFGDFASFVVTDPSGKLGAGNVGWTVASSLNTARRGLQVVAGRIDSANRFLYAIGGEDAAGGALDSVEVAPLDKYGRVGAWFIEKSHLTAPRSGLAVVRQGRYLYAIAGTSSANGTKGASPTGTPLDTVERAKILDPAEAPNVTAATADTTAGTLAKGTWYYKVAAVLNGNDADNANGETLPSDEVIVNLAGPGKVTLQWSASTNPNVDHYIVYRTATANGSSQHELSIKDTVSGLTYTDAGDAAGTAVPQGRGATTKWQVVNATPGAPLHLAHARLNTAAAIGPDGSGGSRIYVVGGWGSCGVTTGLMKCTESIGISAAGDALTAPSVPGLDLVTARMRHGLAVITSTNGPADGGAPSNGGFLLVGGGAGGTPQAPAAVEYAVATAASTWQAANATFANRDGAQVAVANGWAYAFMGGKQPPYSGSSELAQIASTTPTAITLGPWSSTSQTLPANAVTGRFGLAIESAYFYAVAGTTDETDALKSVYQIVY